MEWIDTNAKQVFSHIKSFFGQEMHLAEIDSVF